MRCVLLAMAIAAAASLSPQAAIAQGECDPHVEGFLYNLGCDRLWEERRQERLRALRELDAEYTAAREQNTSLRQRVAAEREVVRQLKASVEENEAALRQLRRVEFDNRSALRVLSELDDRAQLQRAQLQLAQRVHNDFPNVGSPSLWGQAQGYLRRNGDLIEEIHSVSELISNGVKIGEAVFGEEIPAIIEELGTLAEGTETITGVLELAMLI